MRVEQTEQAAALHQSEAARVVAEEKRLHDAQQSEAVCVVAETTRQVSTGAWWVCGCGWGVGLGLGLGLGCWWRERGGCVVVAGAGVGVGVLVGKSIVLCFPPRWSHRCGQPEGSLVRSENVCDHHGDRHHHRHRKKAGDDLRLVSRQTGKESSSSPSQKSRR